LVGVGGKGGGDAAFGRLGEQKKEALVKALSLEPNREGEMLQKCSQYSLLR